MPCATEYWNLVQTYGNLGIAWFLTNTALTDLYTVNHIVSGTCNIILLMIVSRKKKRNAYFWLNYSYDKDA